MKNVFTIFILSFCLPFFSWSQTTWSTKIDYEINEHLRLKNALMKTIDGNYLFVYERNGFVPPYNNSFNHAIAKYDTDGNLLWEKYYSHDENLGHSSGFYPKAAAQKTDGRVAVVGQVLGLDSMIAYLYMTDINGDSLLYRNYTVYEDFRMVADHSQNTIVVYARKQISNGTYILKINTTTGDIIEESDPLPYFNINRYLLPSWSDFIYNYDVVNDSIAIIKYALNSTVLASRKIPLAEVEGLKPSNAGTLGPAMNFIESDDGMIIYNNAVLKLDDNLETNLFIPFNQNSLNLNFALDQHSSDVILPTSDGGYLLSGSTRYGLISMLDMEIFFIKLNALGEEEWSKSYPHWELSSNYVPYMIEDTDGYVFIRHYLDDEIYLTKITKTGQIVSTKSQVSNTQIRVYPNPCTDYIQLNISNEYIGGQLKVMNINGQVALLGYLEKSINKIDLSHIQNGIYFLQLQSNNPLRPILTSKFTKM